MKQSYMDHCGRSILKLAKAMEKEMRLAGIWGQKVALSHEPEPQTHAPALCKRCGRPARSNLGPAAPGECTVCHDTVLTAWYAAIDEAVHKDIESGSVDKAWIDAALNAAQKCQRCGRPLNSRSWVEPSEDRCGNCLMAEHNGEHR